MLLHGTKMEFYGFVVTGEKTQDMISLSTSLHPSYMALLKMLHHQLFKVFVAQFFVTYQI